MERVPLPGGTFEERPAPCSLPNHQVTVLHVYGSLFYAGAQTPQARLPLVGEATQPVVVVSVRGRSMLGATGFKILNDYARSLADAGGRLYLSGVEPSLMEQLKDRLPSPQPSTPVRRSPQGMAPNLAPTSTRWIGQARRPGSISSTMSGRSTSLEWPVQCMASH